MKTNYLIIAQAGFLALTLLCLALVLAGVRQTFRKMNLPRPQANKRLFLLMALFGCWLLIVGTLALNGFLSDFSTFPPKVPLVVLPPLFSIGLLTFNPRFRNFLLQVPPQWLIYLQLFRVPVEIFLWWLFLAHILPEQMTFEGRNFDILAGLTAPVFGWLCYGQGRHNQTLTLFWNILGLGLLLNIVLIAILSLPTPFRFFMNEPSSWRVTTFPFIFLPAVLVPLAYSLHFFSLRKRWLERHPSAPSGN